VLIAGVGMEWCFLINGLSYLAVIGSLAVMDRAELRPNRSPLGPGAIRQGLRYVWRTDGLRRPLLLMSVLFLFSFNYSVLIPLFAERTFGGNAGTLGLLLSVMGVGSLGGALVMAGRANPNERRLALAAIVVGVVTVLVALAPNLDLAVAGMIPLGAASVAFFITANSTLQLSARPEMRGRVMALYGMVFLGSTPFGAPVAGWIGEHFDARVGLAGGGLVALATGAIGLWGLAQRGRAEAVGAGTRRPELPDATAEDALSA
jgi:predicted MFS family arabinose efflux permease